MKICVIGTRGIPNIQGGVEKHCQGLYPRLAKKGLNINIFARKNYFSKSRPSEWQGVNIQYLASPKSSFLEAFIHSLFASIITIFKRPDIAHFHNMGPGLFIPLVKLFGIKTELTYHSINYQHQKWGLLGKFVLRVGEFLSLKFADKVIVVSQTSKTFLERKYKRKDLEYIPNGVETASKDLTNSSVLLKYKLEPKKYIFTASRIVPEKGIQDVLKAYKQIVNPNYKLVIAGSADHASPYSEQVETIAKEYKGVILTGFITGDELAGIFFNAGLFVSASYNEGLPLSVVAALAYGLPVLLSDIPQHMELGLEEERFFPVGDVRALSRKISSLIRLGLSKEDKDRQKNILKRNYNWDIIAARTLEIYKDIV
jgi:glycosyltransferase involved in cell wall biosynthesis